MAIKKAMAKRVQVVLAFSLVLLVAGVSAAAQSSEPAWRTTHYKLVMTPSSSADYLWAAVTASMITKDSGLQITVLESAGSEENMHRIQRKQADIGCVETSTIQKTFKDQHDLRMLFHYAPGVWQMVAAKDSNIKRLKELDGKKWNPGPAGGGSTRITMQILELLGIKPDLFQAGLSDAVEAYEDRQIVGFSYRGTGGEPTPVFVEANSSRPIEFIRLTDEEVEKILQKFPDMKKATLPANLYPGQEQPVNTILNWGTLIAANKDMPNEAVYEFTKSYWKNFEAIVKQYPGIALTSPQRSVNEATLPLHKGAIKYYEEIGLKVPANLIPPDAKQ